MQNIDAVQDAVDNDIDYRSMLFNSQKMQPNKTAMAKTQAQAQVADAPADNKFDSILGRRAFADISATDSVDIAIGAQHL